MAALTRESFSDFENIEQLSQFLHNCVNDLSNESAIKNERNNPDTRKIIQNFYRQRAIEENLSIQSGLPLLPESVVTALEAVYKIRYTDIINSLVKEKLINNGHNLLEAFDWKLKWVLGSSKLASIREPICQVELCCVSLGKDLKPCRNSINFECNLEQIDKLISILSGVKNELDLV